MEDVIKAFNKKPFRGITTIQLFDKDTGELVKEVRHENTYNQRLMYFTYFDEILQTGGRFMTANNPPLGSGWIGPASNFYVNRRCYNNWTRLNSTDPRGENDSFNLFATLFLTNHTEDASASGYANGIPVSVTPLAGVSTYASSRPAMGTINIQESWKGNDRIHFVVDFDTSHGNFTFDSLWIYPSDYERGFNNSAQNTCADVYPFQTARHLRTTARNTRITSLAQNYYFITYRINYPYTVLIEYIDSSRYYNIRAIYIYNEETDSIEIQHSFDSNNYPRYWVPTFYNASAKILRGWYYCNQTYWGPSWVGSSPSFRFYITNINLETGVISYDTSDSNCIPLRVGMTLNGLNLYNSTNTWCGLYYYNNTAYLVALNQGKDENLADVWRLSLYQVNLDTNVFTLVTMREISRNFGMEGIRFYDNLMFVPNVSLTPGGDSTKGIVIDITSGNVIEQKWDTNPVDWSFWRTSGDMCSTLGDTYYYLGFYARDQINNDLLIYLYPNHHKVKHFNYISRGSGVAQAYEVDYVTAIWSTHNHLDEPITKTNQTTMKIQYDIIWDSITEVICPAIL